MSLPMFLDQVKYKLAGTYAYEGELVLSQGMLYYFPHTDLIQKSLDKRKPSVTNIVLGGLAGVVDAVDKDSIMRMRDYETYFKEQRPSELQRKLDGYIADLKEKQSKVISSTALPVPLRFEKGSIRDISFSILGTLSFSDKYDTHTFRFWLTDSRRLKRALTEAGFLSSS